MDKRLIVRGRYAGRRFISDSPLPDAEGVAELVNTLDRHRRAGPLLTLSAPLIYLDANVVIRLVEGDAATRAPLAARLGPSLGVPLFLRNIRERPMGPAWPPWLLAIPFALVCLMFLLVWRTRKAWQTDEPPVELGQRAGAEAFPAADRPHA
jgi:hypothetical protein